MSSKIADHVDLDRASPWARKVFEALSDWDAARRGKWSTWDGGELLMEIETAPTGLPCERLAILAADGRVGLSMRDFELQLPAPTQTFERAIEDLKGLVRQWFSGEIVIAAFYDGQNWRGSTLIDPKKQEEELGPTFQWVRKQGPVDRVEIQTPFADRDLRLAVAINGQLQPGSGQG